jgi:hypothetical protein
LFTFTLNKRTKHLVVVQVAARWTLWVKRFDAPAPRYSSVADVDPSQTVDAFIRDWVQREQVQHAASLVSLQLVPSTSAGSEPTQEDEENATLLSSRQTLMSAGVTNGSSLLAILPGELRYGAGLFLCARSICVCLMFLVCRLSCVCAWLLFAEDARSLAQALQV